MQVFIVIKASEWWKPKILIASRPVSPLERLLILFVTQRVSELCLDDAIVFRIGLGFTLTLPNFYEVRTIATTRLVVAEALLHLLEELVVVVLFLWLVSGVVLSGTIDEIVVKDVVVEVGGVTVLVSLLLLA